MEHDKRAHRSDQQQPSATLPDDLNTISSHQMQFRRPPIGVGQGQVGQPPREPPQETAPAQSTSKHAPSRVFSFHEEVTPASHRDLQFFSLALPSRFFWYDFDEISFRLVNGRAQAKFTKAAAENNHAVFLEALTALCATPERFNQLTISDYQYVMYWLRLSSYTAGRLNAQHLCTNPSHRQKVAEGVLSSDTLITPVSIARSSFEETLLDPSEMSAVIDASRDALSEYGVEVDAPRVRDLLPTLSYFESSGAVSVDANGDAVIDPELQFLADTAGAIRGLNRDLSLEERIKVVGEFSDLALTAVERFTAAYSQVGIKEFITTRCSGCGAEARTRVHVSALTFLRQGE